MTYTDYFGRTEFTFSPDESGIYPPPVRLSSANWRARLNGAEKDSVSKNIENARNSVNVVVDILNNGSPGPEQRAVMDKYFKGNNGLSYDKMREYSELVADKMYADKMNITVTDYLYHDGDRLRRYQRAPHRRAIGRVKPGADPDALSIEMVKSGISGADGAQNFLGTIAASVRQDGRVVRVSDFVEFVRELNEACDRDAVRRLGGAERLAGRRSDDALYFAPARNDGRGALLSVSEGPRDARRIESIEIRPYKSETTDAIHALVDGAAPSGHEAFHGTEDHLTDWYENQLDLANGEEDLNIIERKKEDFEIIDGQISHLINKKDEYTAADRGAITDALLDGMDDLQHKALCRGLEARHRSRAEAR